MSGRIPSYPFSDVSLKLMNQEFDSIILINTIYDPMKVVIHQTKCPIYSLTFQENIFPL